MKILPLILTLILIIPLVSADITFVEDEEEKSKPIVLDNHCGNKRWDEGENCLNCKQDAICPIGYACNSEGTCSKKSSSGFVAFIIIFIIITLAFTILTLLGYFEILELDWRFMANFAVISTLILFVVVLAFLKFDTIKLFVLKPSDADATVVIKEPVFEKLNEYYARSGNEEFVTCLRGVYDDGRYFINDVTVPQIMESESYLIQYKACPMFNNLGTLHSHPKGKCELSKTDIYAFGKKGDIFTGIMCDYDTIALFTRQWLDIPLYYVVSSS